MAHAMRLADSVRRDLVVRLGNYAQDLPGVNANGPVQIELHESFELWSLTRSSASENAVVPLSRRARITGHWYHVLHVQGKPAAVAYSYSTARKRPSPHRLRGVFATPIAARIDNAITWLDENASDELEARLLVVPYASIDAFWLTDGNAIDQILVISAPARLGLPRERLLPVETFYRALARTGPMGLLMRRRLPSR